jgi:hypothetical protein
MSKMKSFACALAFACAVPAAQAAVITFNDLAGTAMQGNTNVSSYTQFFYSTATVDGFKFGAVNNGYFDTYIIGPDYTGTNAASSLAYNGNDYFLSFSPVLMKAANGAAFSVSSLDLGTWSGGALSITLLGTRTNGSTVTQSLSTTIYNQQTTNDFNSLVLNGFTGLASLQFTSSTGNGFAIDNIVVNEAAVPEPGSLAIFGLGLAAVAGLRRRKG